MEIKGRNIAGHDDADAQYQLYFDCRDRGENVECIKWLRKAAEHGIPEAWVNLGHCYHYGKGVVRDCRDAVKLYRKGARMDDALAFYNLGACLINGIGCEGNAKEAVAWFRKAARRGNGFASSEWWEWNVQLSSIQYPVSIIQ